MPVRCPLLVFACAASALSIASSAQAQVVALGASIVQGYGVSASEAFPALVEADLRARGKPYRVLNAGHFGDTTADVLERMDADVPRGTKIVILAVGGNDIRDGSTREAAIAGVQEITRRLRARGIQVVNANPFVRQAVQAGMVQMDRIHLTAEGHRLVAARIEAAIR